MRMETIIDLEEKALAEEMEAIAAGTHKGYLKRIQELDNIKDQRTLEAEKWRLFQVQNIENIFQAESKQSKEECEVHFGK
jgi:hypothetical protein